jgi:hypothetical protein
VKSSCKLLRDSSASNIPATYQHSFWWLRPCSICSNMLQHVDLLFCTRCRWYVPASAGPPGDGPSTQLWVYRSTVDVVRDTQAGLAGPLVIARPGGLDAEGRPADVDREIYMLQGGYVSNMLFMALRTSPSMIIEPHEANTLQKDNVTSNTSLPAGVQRGQQPLL